MALPRINESPQYSLVVPSSGKSINYRPYLVKEEKVLLMAVESQDPEHIFGALSNTITSCVKDEIDLKNLTIFDFEYIFTQLRAKSSGENLKLAPKCKHCEEVNNTSINLDNLKVNMPEVNLNIKLTDDISIKMKYPTYKDVLLQAKGFDKLSLPDQAFKLVNKCLESISTKEENILVEDVSEDEVNEFIESLTNEQFNKIKEILDSMPRLKHTIEFNCTSCHKDNEIKLEGINDFF